MKTSLSSFVQSASSLCFQRKSNLNNSHVIVSSFTDCRRTEILVDEHRGKKFAGIVPFTRITSLNQKILHWLFRLIYIYVPQTIRKSFPLLSHATACKSLVLLARRKSTMLLKKMRAKPKDVHEGKSTIYSYRVASGCKLEVHLHSYCCESVHFYPQFPIVGITGSHNALMAAITR